MDGDITPLLVPIADLMKKRFVLLSLFFFLPCHLAADILLVDNRVRTSYEELTLPGSEKLGLLGLGYLIDSKLDEHSSFYYGLGVYSAVSGQRGGFFTGGGEFGLRYRAGRFVLDGGLFVGGGGGGAAPQGGGLMLRPHAGALYDFGTFSLGLEYSMVRFPNGNIDSDQVTLVAEFPFRSLFTDDDEVGDLSGLDLRMAPVYIAPALQHYSPTDSAREATGVQAMTLAGIELGRFINDNAWFFLESSAAFRGDADGYAELLGGVGYRYPLTDRIAIQARLSAGAAGGGSIDTGGGFIYKASLGAELALTDALSLGLDYGIIDAPDGTFEAEMARLSLRYATGMATPANEANRIPPESLRTGKWALRVSHVTYLSDPSLRKDASGGEVNLIAIKADRMLSERFYVTGQAAAAYEGDAGGYATGLLGAGYRQMLSDRLSIRAELLAGPAGGGGINTSGGAILQPMAGLSWRLSKNLDFALMAGKLRSLKGDLDTEVLDVGLVYRFNTLESR
ncbi:MAG: hypothetical protein PVG16_01160 [Chromatiales bacterium]|jgi:hypothetical protein